MSTVTSAKTYTVTINVARVGVRTTNNGRRSPAGHMWYSLGDGTKEDSYGFGPQKEGVKALLPGPGEPKRNDNALYPERYSRTIEITKAQYDAMQKFGKDPKAGGFDMTYNLLTNSCVDFTWKALEKAGLNPRGYEGDWLPWANGNFLYWPGLPSWLNYNEIERIGKTGLEAPEDGFLFFLDSMRRVANERWNQAKSWVLPRIDPLALDLDGDGIETRGADGKIVFDHNNDGVKTGTGWVHSDDGLLVLDRNSNGTIDNGGELFGVDTVKSDGTKASDGFDALSDLDSNNDNIFDSKDTRFADVRIWRDLNQDGVSQSNELSTLAANNIRSVSLNKTSATTNLGNGNTQTATATYTRTDDTTGTAANLGLAGNPFYRQFTNRITLTDNAKKLPEVRGSGTVRDLREAMSGSSSLTTLVDTYAKQTTYTSQRAQLEGLLRAWAGTSTQTGSRRQAESNGFTLIYMIPGQTSAHFRRTGLTTSNGNSGTSGTTLTAAEQTQRRALMAEQGKITKMIDVLEAFNGNRFVTVNSNSITTGAGTRITSSTTSSGGLTTQSRAFVALSQQQINLLKQSYRQLKESVYISLLKQTRLDDYTDKISVTVNTQGKLALDFSAMNTLLTTRRTSKAVDTLGDLIELAHHIGPGLAAHGWNGFSTLKTWASEADGKAAQEKVLTDLGVKSGNADASGTDKAEIFYDGSNGSTINAGGGNDIVFGGGGNDTLNGGSGDDMLHGEGLAMPPLWALRREPESSPSSFRRELESSPPSFRRELESNPPSFRRELESNPSSFRRRPESSGLDNTFPPASRRE